jgi:hypothetical protein
VVGGGGETRPAHGALRVGRGAGLTLEGTKCGAGPRTPIRITPPLQHAHAQAHTNTTGTPHSLHNTTTRPSTRVKSSSQGMTEGRGLSTYIGADTLAPLPSLFIVQVVQERCLLLGHSCHGALLGGCARKHTRTRTHRQQRPQHQGFHADRTHTQQTGGATATAGE